MSELFSTISEYLWGFPMIVLLIGTHLYLTIRLRFPQRYIGKAIKLSFIKDKNSKGDVSQFSALMTSLAATIGTGNIIGVATAITLGGPGAVFWCWLTGFLGIATRYSEALLAVKYRTRTAHDTMVGGPMYAIERGMKCKWLAVLFACFAFLASFGIGDMVQSNAIATVLQETLEIPAFWTGTVCTIIVGAVIIFGVKGISNVCKRLVPFMAISYLLGCLTLICINIEWIIPAFKLIISDAFSSQSISGGVIGSIITVAMRYGIARGLFSNESGMGSAPIIAAAAQTKNPIRQALVSSTSVFWDTVVMCAMTGLVLVSSSLADNSIDINNATSGLLTQKAFAQIPWHIGTMPLGTIILTIAICTFAFSTILGWSYYGEKALEYLCGKHGKTGCYVFRILITLATFAGANWTLDAVWNFGDTANALMAIPNLICLICLSGVLVKETKHYLWDGNLDEEAEV